jgi:hypothetical protein
MSAFPLPNCHVHFNLLIAQMGRNLPINTYFLGCKMPDFFPQSAQTSSQKTQIVHDLIFSQAS